MLFRSDRPLIPMDETPGHETYRVALDPNLYFDFTAQQGETIEDDLAQRDFTINAIAIHLAALVNDKSKLIDPFQGQRDLDQKIIRSVREQAFKDDPIRLLRAFRFASTLEFDIESQTLSQIKTHRAEVDKVARERVRYEFLLMLEAPQSRMDLMEPTGLIEVLFPGIEELKMKPGIPDRKSQWENTLDVFRETENILVHADRLLEKHSQLMRESLSTNHHRALLKWCALIHLFAATYDSSSGIINFLKEFRLSNADIQFIERTLKFTRIILSGVRSTSEGFKEDSTVYQFIHRSGKELFSSILLSLAVRLGNQEDIKYFLPVISRILDFYAERYLPAQEKPALLDGDILKNKLQLKPSPEFKSILEKVEEARVLGNIHTPDEAEQLAKKLISSQAELIE